MRAILALLAIPILAAALAAADDPPIETDGPVKITVRRDDAGRVVAVRISPLSSCGPNCKCGQAAAELAADPLAKAVRAAVKAEAGDAPALAAKAATIYQGLAARARVAPVTTWAEFQDAAFAEADGAALLKGVRAEVLRAIRDVPAADRARPAAAFKTAGRALAALAGGDQPAGGGGGDHVGH